MVSPSRSVIIAGERSSLSDRIEKELLRAGSPVRRIGRPEHLGSIGSSSSRAVLHVALPPGGGRELREFRRGIAAQTFALAQVMGARPSILVVVERRRVGVNPAHVFRLESLLTRMRAAAQHELALTVTVNALVLSGLVDDRTVSYRVLEAMRGRALPDSDYVVQDEDVRTQSISAVISEERS